MKKLVLFLFLLPFFAKAQVTGTAQITAATNTVRVTTPTGVIDSVAVIQKNSLSNLDMLRWNAATLKFIPRTPAQVLSDIGAASATTPFTLAAIGSSPNANGATLSSGTFNLQPASASFGGVMTTGTQTLAGDKTLTGSLTNTAFIAKFQNFTLTNVTNGVVGDSVLTKHPSTNQMGRFLATSSNIFPSIVERDNSGNFSAGTITSSAFNSSGIFTSTASAGDIVTAINGAASSMRVRLANTGGYFIAGINNSAGNDIMTTAAYASYIFTHNSTDLVLGTNDVPRLTLGSAGTITAGTTLAMGSNNITSTGSLGSTGSRLTKLWATDIESTNMPTVGGTSLSSTFAPIASPTFTGTVTIPSPFTLGATSVTTTGTKLNFLTSAAGTTGTTSTNLVFSTSPTLVTPVLGVASATSLALSGALSGATTIGASSVISSAGGVKVTGLIAPVGLGAEVVYTGGVGIFQTYNRTGSVYLPTALDGSTVKLQISGVEALGIDASKNSIFAGTLGINGTADNVKGSTYTPTLTNGTNVASSTAQLVHYTRIGNEISMSGSLLVTPTAGSNTSTIVSLSPIVASNFTVATDVRGVANTLGTLGTGGPCDISADTTSDLITINFGSLNTGSHTIEFSIHYTVK